MVVTDTKFRDILPAGRPTDVTPVWVVTSKKAIEKGELLKTMAKTGKPRKHAGKDYYFDESNWAGILMLDEKSYAYASEDAITALIDRMAKGGESPLAAVFTREADKHPVTVGVNVAALATPDMLKGHADGTGPALQGENARRDARPQAQDRGHSGSGVRK